jgi:hypothetical protein
MRPSPATATVRPCRRQSTARIWDSDHMGQSTRTPTPAATLLGRADHGPLPISLHVRGERVRSDEVPRAGRRRLRRAEGGRRDVQHLPTGE